MFRRLLIANRGEIAQRIARTARRLGIETVAVHSEADRGAPWLDDVDRTVCVGPARSSESYLDVEAVVQAAEQTRCQAIHPGYGFLSENALFAAMCVQQGIAFVGPGPGAIRRMGDKSQAKRNAAAAGLPTIPGSAGIVPSVAAAREIAETIGYPVLLKATAGGGGRGMRVCRDAGALDGAFRDASLEAEKSFGDGGLYLEKLIEGGRHVEFQVLCDAFGNGVHLGERDCSVQRNHQKLVEESPSPAVDAERRATFGERVARAAVSLGYVNAGTVEFLMDEAGELYFMEMNTRLQVEHPVTEAITGLDLVEAQLRVAALEPLPWPQEAITFEGHAVELRINAENPDAGFRPDPGEIIAFEAPPSEIAGAAVRWDSPVRSGYRIPPYYDSMIGKLIVHGRDRAHALRAADEALGAMRIDGVATTVELHRRILRDDTFRSGRYDVRFLERSGLLSGV